MSDPARSRALPLFVGGGACGLAWAAGLRGFMAQITEDSSVSWSGTFGYILLPGILVGVLLGWAEQGSDLAIHTPRGLWVALYYYSFLALFMLAASIPHRRVASKPLRR